MGLWSEERAAIGTVFELAAPGRVLAAGQTDGVQLEEEQAVIQACPMAHKICV